MPISLTPTPFGHGCKVTLRSSASFHTTISSGCNSGMWACGAGAAVPLGWQWDWAPLVWGGGCSPPPGVALSLLEYFILFILASPPPHPQHGSQRWVPFAVRVSDRWQISFLPPRPRTAPFCLNPDVLHRLQLSVGEPRAAGWAYKPPPPSATASAN